MAKTAGWHAVPNPCQLRRSLTGYAVGLCAVVVMASFSARRPGVAMLDTGQQPTQAEGTISGTVRAPESSADIKGRLVEVVNVETNERRRTKTNTAGGFTVNVKPGKYRVELPLRADEALVRHPGILHVNRSAVDTHADFVIRSTRASRPRGAGSRPEVRLGSPIA